MRQMYEGDGESVVEAKDGRTIGVNDAIDDLSSSNTNLLEIIEALSHRLTPVMLLPGANPGERLAPARERSPLASRISDEAARVDMGSELLRGLLHRLDV